MRQCINGDDNDGDMWPMQLQLQRPNSTRQPFMCGNYATLRATRAVIACVDTITTSKSAATSTECQDAVAQKHLHASIGYFHNKYYCARFWGIFGCWVMMMLQLLLLGNWATRTGALGKVLSVSGWRPLLRSLLPLLLRLLANPMVRARHPTKFELPRELTFVEEQSFGTCSADAPTSTSTPTTTTTASLCPHGPLLFNPLGWNSWLCLCTCAKAPFGEWAKLAR